MRVLLGLLLLTLLLPVAAAEPEDDESRGECVATSTSGHVSVSIAGCLRLVPATGPLPG